MSVEIVTEAAQFPEKENINGIFLADSQRILPFHKLLLLICIMTLPFLFLLSPPSFALPFPLPSFFSAFPTLPFLSYLPAIPFSFTFFPSCMALPFFSCLFFPTFRFPVFFSFLLIPLPPFFSLYRSFQPFFPHPCSFLSPILLSVLSNLSFFVLFFQHHPVFYIISSPPLFCLFQPFHDMQTFLPCPLFSLPNVTYFFPLYAT